MTHLSGQSAHYKPSLPRRVRHGIKLASRERVVPANWVVGRWITVIESLIDAESMIDGYDYGRSGQTSRLSIEPGLLSGTVQGRAARPYEVKIKMAMFEHDRWEQIIEAMTAEATYVARLLARELPEAVDDLLQRHESPLVPDASSIEMRCTCGAVNPCKHIATICLLAAEKLNADPFLAFMLRGIPMDRVDQQLRHHRMMRTHGVAQAHSAPPVAQQFFDPQPLELCLEDFWRPGPELTELERMAPPEHAPHALLRRLGNPPLGGRFPLIGLMQSIYDVVAADAVRLRDRAEATDEPTAD